MNKPEWDREEFGREFVDSSNPISLNEWTETLRMESFIDEQISLAKNTPMGVSAWKAHGEKYGYWFYHEADAYKFAKKEGREEVLEALKYDLFPVQIKMENPIYWQGYTDTVEKVKEILTNKDNE